MNSIQKPRGTQDIFFHNFDKFSFIINTAENLMRKHNFYQIKTPTFENTELFERNIGQETDAISKELYKFEDRGGRSIALRPEFTAGIVRAYLENKELYTFPAPLRLFSWGQVFRYDRPKKGRFREFHQINFEFFNDDNNISILAIAIDLLKNLGVLGKVKLLVNYLGEAKTPYTDAVRKYFIKHIEELSDISKTRLEKNPLRILDSKEPEDISLLKHCPKISEFYSENDKNTLKEIRSFLKNSGVNFEEDSSLVRGLDYYTGIVFEFVAPIADDGSNMAVLGGGRYDDLVSQMGGKPTSAIGFGGGIERLALLVNNVEIMKRIFIVDTTGGAELTFKLIENLSQKDAKASFQQIKIEKNKIGKTLQKLAQVENAYAIVIGYQELKAKKALIKNLATLETEEIILQ